MKRNEMNSLVERSINQGLQSQGRVMGGIALLLCLFMLFGCTGQKKNLISRYGLSYIQLGDDLPPAGIPKFKKYDVHDTIMETEEYTWRATVLKYKKGKVYLEEDFWGSEMLSRIRITTPELHLKNGMSVGTTVLELTQGWDEWFIIPFPEYKLFDFYSRLYPRIHFLISDQGVDMTDPEYGNYRVSDFNPEAKVRWIVIL